jgi:hypothetical protein
MMAGWVASGGMIEFILALTVLEVLGIFWLRRVGATMLTMGQVLPNVLAGDFLLLAWLSDVRGAGWGVTATCLLGALVSHSTDLVLRWRAG